MVGTITRSKKICRLPNLPLCRGLWQNFVFKLRVATFQAECAPSTERQSCFILISISSQLLPQRRWKVLHESMFWVLLQHIFYYFKFLLDQGPFCVDTGTLCLRLRMTLPMGFKVRVDSSLHMLFCCLCITIPRIISGCQDQVSNRIPPLWGEHDKNVPTRPGFTTHDIIVYFSCIFRNLNVTTTICVVFNFTEWQLIAR